MPQLPRFASPPLVETVLSVEFQTLPRWDVPYFGLFWEFIRQDFPAVETHLAVESETSEDGPPIQFINRPPLRCWYIHNDRSRLIQVQRNRFMHNWRKESTNYPHYDSLIRPSFIAEWVRYQDFIRQHKLGDLNVIRCEVTYISHIEQGTGWESFADLGRVFRFWSKSSSLSLPIEGASTQLNLSLPEKYGRLRVTVKPAVRTEDGKRLLALEITARGAPASPSPDRCIDWLDIGREWVVRTFAEITTDEMHAIWKRTQ